MTKEQLLKLQHFVQRFATEQPLYTIDDKPTLLPHIYGAAISEFIEFMYAEKLVPTGDMETAEESNLAADQQLFISGLSMENCEKLLSAFVRIDRFDDGFLGKQIKNGNLQAIVHRLVALI